MILQCYDCNQETEQSFVGVNPNNDLHLYECSACDCRNEISEDFEEFNRGFHENNGQELEHLELVLHGKYNFKNQPERLIYIGKNWSGNGYWHQFEKVGEQGVWCEIQDTELKLIEKTIEWERR